MLSGHRLKKPAADHTQNLNLKTKTTFILESITLKNKIFMYFLLIFKAVEYKKISKLNEKIHIFLDLTTN